MNRMVQPGLEVASHNGPEIVAQPDENKYCTTASDSNKILLIHVDEEIHPVSKISQNKAFRALAVIAILCLAAAIGAGLGAGLATKHKSSTSSPVITVTQSGNTFTTTPAPAITPTTPSTSTTTSPVCPAANGSTYIATNKPSSDLGAVYVIPETSLRYQILCNTNFRTNNETAAAIDTQILNNVTSLQDCLDACALYSFQTPPKIFPAFGCSGAVWNHNTVVPDCWLKRSLILSESDSESGVDAGILLSD